VHILSRRRAFQLAGVVGASALVAACSTGTDKKAGSPTTTSTVKSGGSGGAAATACAKTTPAETAGPFPADGSNGPNVLGEEGVVRSDIRTSFGVLSGWAEGVQTTIELTLVDITNNCAKGEGMAVYLWHCDRAGSYSMYAGPAADKNYLRGVQVADQDGRVSFTTVFPACATDRWPHFNIEVFGSPGSAVAGENASLTSQIALPEDACKKVYDYDKGYGDSAKNISNMKLESDSVFGDGSDAQLATVSGDPDSALLVTMTIGLGEKTTAAPPPGPPG
jgi:protocatechuate 3,4-dioxygenase beta subunit